MSKQKTKAHEILIFIALLAVLGSGLLHIFHMRFELGDIYPAYSTLRADPVGGKALYESLEQIPKLNVTRSHEEIDLIDLPPSNTIFMLAYKESWQFNHEDIQLSEVAELNHFFNNHGRIIITLPPTPNWREFVNVDKEDSEENAEEDIEEDGDNNDGQEDEIKEVEEEPAKEPEDDEENTDRTRLKLTNWLDVAACETQYMITNAFCTDEYSGILPDTLPVYTTTCFTNVSDCWSVLYSTDAGPVIISKKTGNGSIILSASSYYLSNEALREADIAELLKWMIGNNRAIIFDEVHLGIYSQKGVATLARKHGLYWFVFTACIIAGLFIWKNTTSLVPPPYTDAQDEETPIDISTGKNSPSALANLLKQNIRRKALIDICFSEWKKHKINTSGLNKEFINKVKMTITEEEAKPKSEQNQGELYNSIHTMIEKEKRRY